MKKNRNERLYLNYVQHGKNKTIIAPYSPRKTETGTVATPLYWEELKTELNPKKFTIKTIVDRVKTMGCPWLNTYNKVRKVKDRKSTRLNSSHVAISYAVFCWKKKRS